MSNSLCDGIGKVGLAGDWHGNTLWATRALVRLADAGVKVVYHLGDFGIWPGKIGYDYLAAVARVCADRGLHVIVTLGNHEDYDQVERVPLTDAGDGMGSVRWITSGICLLPRVHRWTVTSPNGTARSLASLGGAPSVDFEMRTIGWDWWPQEAVTGDDIERVAAGGRAEVMLAHDAPDSSSPAVRRILASNPAGFSARALAYATEGRQLMNAAFAGVRPRMYVHGHYHVRDHADVPHRDISGALGDDSCRFISLACDGMPGNLAVLNLDDLTLEWLDE